MSATAWEDRLDRLERFRLDDLDPSDQDSLYNCPRCDAEFAVCIVPGSRGRTVGAPEDWEEPEADTTEPAECPECGRAVTL
jgi:DNA-directed RNA polymerase subunit RPC12/RpoP